jgi:hypothetical protein
MSFCSVAFVTTSARGSELTHNSISTVRHATAFAPVIDTGAGKRSALINRYMVDFDRPTNLVISVIRKSCCLIIRCFLVSMSRFLTAKSCLQPPIYKNSKLCPYMTLRTYKNMYSFIFKKFK